MRAKKQILKKREVWHSHFDAGLVAAFFILLFFTFIGSFSFAGAMMISATVYSIIILTHRHRHHLTILGTIVSAYLAAGFSSMLIVTLLKMGMAPAINQAIAVLIIITALLYALNLFHPPAVLFAAAFVVFRLSAESYVIVLLLTILIFIITRLAVYTLYDNLKIRDFAYEFIREEQKIISEGRKRIRKGAKRI